MAGEVSAIAKMRRQARRLLAELGREVWMAISEKVIQEAVSRYDRERDRYLKLAARVADLCMALVEENAIRAQITSRTKTVKSFAGKLQRFAKNPEKDFPTVDKVFAEIGDFAGVRVATYRPEDEAKVAEAIRKVFIGASGGEIDIDLKDKLNPSLCQFYRATHCQVYLRDEELVGDYSNLRNASCEIQVCSMMAHVWNEIEHDIGYKPEGDGPALAERGLLESLGHLARSGDATITQLLAANKARLTAQTSDFQNVHDFVAQLQKHFPDADLSVNAGQAFEAAMNVHLTSAEKIVQRLGAEALQAESAAAKIEAFNAYLSQTHPTQAMNPYSADLLLISFLAAFNEVLSRDKSGKSHIGGAGRTQRLAAIYRDYTESHSAPPVAG